MEVLAKEQNFIAEGFANFFIRKRFIIFSPFLSVELKLELLSKLSDSLKTEFKSNKTEKEVLFEELCGAWSDMDDDLEKEIMESRMISE